MPKVSAGLVLFRRGPNGGPEVLLGHMGGPFWRGREAGAWTIPKGLPERGEDLLDTARRETREEFGLAPPGPFLPLRPIHQAGGKLVHAWAAEADADPATLRSNCFGVQWPPRSGRWQDHPELDRFAWLSLPDARHLIVRAQAMLLDELEAALEDEGRLENRFAKSTRD
ncbi:MAG: NUDIX domain-containing protein [Geminicoccaceae bacterium]